MNHLLTHENNLTSDDDDMNVPKVTLSTYHMYIYTCIYMKYITCTYIHEIHYMYIYYMYICTCTYITCVSDYCQVIKLTQLIYLLDSWTSWGWSVCLIIISLSHTKTLSLSLFNCALNKTVYHKNLILYQNS